jgi:hypothetical protein
MGRYRIHTLIGLHPTSVPILLMHVLALILEGLLRGSLFQLNYFDSVWYMDLSSPKPYTVAQNVKLTVGLPYFITANISKSSDERCGNISRGIIRVSGIPDYTFTVPSNAWSNLLFNFTAAFELSLLEIGSIAQPGCGPRVRCK